MRGRREGEKMEGEGILEICETLNIKRNIADEDHEIF